MAISKRFVLAGLALGACSAFMSPAAIAGPLEDTANSMLASDSSCGGRLLDSQQRRVLQQATQGADVVRDFLYIRRAMWQIDMYDVADWMDGWSGTCQAPMHAIRHSSERRL